MDILHETVVTPLSSLISNEDGTVNIKIIIGVLLLLACVIAAYIYYSWGSSPEKKVTFNIDTNSDVTEPEEVEEDEEVEEVEDEEVEELEEEEVEEVEEEEEEEEQ